MFGIGFTELLLISIVAILFLGPDKLPEALVQIAKFIKGVKKTIGEAKSSLDEELRIADLKEEALSYKKQLDAASSELQGFKNIDLDDMNDLLTYEESEKTAPASSKPSPYADEKPVKKVEAKSETVTFKKASKKKKKQEKAKEEGKEIPEEEA
jgi:sec-independent protein translocase protein TatB